VRELGVRDDSYAIIRAVTELAKTLKIETVAEGVETREHLDAVERAGCNEVQGFYFSQPVPSSEVPEVLTRCRLKCIAVKPRTRIRTQHRPVRQRRAR
jgi:EAL domain-containing protein (putative c-di-GMP-specific phosphodiesterase class I)